MKKTVKKFVVLVLVTLLVTTAVITIVSPPGVVLAMGKTLDMDIDCGQPWLIEGECIPVQRENIPAPAGNYLHVDVTTVPERWIITVGVTIPDYPVLLGGNYNKFSISGIKVFADQRPYSLTPFAGYFSSLTVVVVLKCDQNGSTNPTGTFSVPEQYAIMEGGRIEARYPASTALGIKDQIKLMTVDV